MVENHNMVNPYRRVFVPCLNLNSEIEDSSSCSSSSFVLEILLAPKLPPGTGCDSEPTAKLRQDDDEIAERKGALNDPIQYLNPFCPFEDGRKRIESPTRTAS